MTSTSGSHPTSSAASSAATPAATPAVPARDYTVRAVDRVCAILNLLQESVDGSSLIDVGLATDLPKSSAFRYLWTLENHRYVERDAETGLYRLGLGFIGMQSRHLELLRHRAHPLLTRLRDELGETVNLGVLDGDAAVYLDIVESRRGVRLAVTQGVRDPLHSTALGKAIAAHLPEQQVRDILARSGMPALTANTITDPDRFVAALAQVRRSGVAVDDRENDVDGRCVAVRIPGTRLPAALSVSAPSSRLAMADVERVAAMLKEVAAAVTSGNEHAPFDADRA